MLSDFDLSKIKTARDVRALRAVALRDGWVVAGTDAEDRFAQALRLPDAVICIRVDVLSADGDSPMVRQLAGRSQFATDLPTIGGINKYEHHGPLRLPPPAEANRAAVAEVTEVLDAPRALPAEVREMLIAVAARGYRLGPGAGFGVGVFPSDDSVPLGFFPDVRTAYRAAMAAPARAPILHG